MFASVGKIGGKEFYVAMRLQAGFDLCHLLSCQVLPNLIGISIRLLVERTVASRMRHRIKSELRFSKIWKK